MKYLGILTMIQINQRVVAIHELPLQNRKVLNDTVFDIIGLTEDERNEVYWAVCELVRNRLEKARNV